MKSVATRIDTRCLLIEAGAKVMLSKGYNNTGIQEIVKLVGVPKGSFYHYFESKEAFALAVIEKFDQAHRSKLTKSLGDKSRSSLDRLTHYFQAGADELTNSPCRGGCLIGTLSQEMSGQSELLREKLALVMDGWKAEFAACLKEGQEKGEIRRDLCPNQLAELVLSGFEGAVLRSKATNSPAPLQSFQGLMPRLLTESSVGA